jgi:GTP-binding protein
VTVDVDADYSGVVVDKLSQRRGELVEMREGAGGKTRIVAHVPSRGLIGYHGEFLTDTRGTGVLNRVFHGWAPWRGPMPGRRTGVLVSMEDGTSVPYAIFNLEDRGRFFIGGGEQVYRGMIVAEHARENDLDVNPLKAKKLTNIRASGKDEAVTLTPPVRLTLEQAIAYIADDELVEVTPRHIRLRKRHLDPVERKRLARQESA